MIENPEDWETAKPKIDFIPIHSHFTPWKHLIEKQFWRNFCQSLKHSEIRVQSL